jgi:hypothetical protein
MIGDSNRVLRVFLAGELKANERQCRQDADAGGNDCRQRPQDERILERLDDGFILGQFDEPAQADAFHGEDAELLGVECQHDDHDDGGEQEQVDQKRINPDQ